MALSINQALTVSYPLVLNDKRKPTNQWAENAFLRECERMGVLVKKALGPYIEANLDYRRNPDAAFLASDLAPTGMTKTEVLTAAQYTPAQISVPIVWSKMDEATNPTDNQRADLVVSLSENALTSHDDLLEAALFATSTNGFLGLATLVPTTGQGTVGGIDASLETWFRNHADAYQSDGSDIEAVFTEAFNTAAKGSGSPLAPKMMISGADANALYESQLQPQIRFQDTKEGDAGFKVIAFKTARYSFSQYGGDEVYFLNPKSFQVVCSSTYFRDLDERLQFEGAEGFKRTVYSALQSVTDNKSRLAVVSQA